MRLSPKKLCTLEIDVRVEDNGTFFLVYPLSDFGREWLEKDEKMSRVGRFQTKPKWERLGDILLVQRPRILGLVERMVSGDLWVVWR